MKSIVEEASSITKAIENGWIRAGKPKEFTVRVFEEPEKNFFGITKKPAKVGIFFNGDTVQQRPSLKHRDTKNQQQSNRKQVKGPQKDASLPQDKSKKIEQRPISATKNEQSQSIPQGAKDQQKVLWTPDMIKTATEWLTHTLTCMGKGPIAMTTQTKKYELLIQLEAPVIHDKRREQFLLKNTSLIMIQAMRFILKRALHGYRITISSRDTDGHSS